MRAQHFLRGPFGANLNTLTALTTSTMVITRAWFLIDALFLILLLVGCLPPSQAVNCSAIGDAQDWKVDFDKLRNLRSAMCENTECGLHEECVVTRSVNVARDCTGCLERRPMTFILHRAYNNASGTKGFPNCQKSVK